MLADISGFTAFVTETELEHGPPIIAALLEEVIERICPPLDLLEIATSRDAVRAGLAPRRECRPDRNELRR